MVLPPKNLVFLDFETFYDSKDKYSLRTQKFSMTQYIRDPRFKVHTMALRYGRMRKARVCYGYEECKSELKKIDWKRSALVAHNAAFDGGILSYHFGVVPAFYFCTMSMARPLHGHDVGAGLDEVAKHYGLGGKVKAGALEAINGVRDLSKEQLKALGEYNKDDVDDMHAIFHKMIGGLPNDEILLIHHTIKAYADPILEVDRPLATSEWEREKAERRKIVLRTYPIIRSIYDELAAQGQLDDLPYTRNKPSLKNPLGTPKKGEVELWEPAKERETRYERLLSILGSPDKLSFVFRTIGHPPPMKWSEKQGMDIPAFALGDLEFQVLETHPDKNVRLLYAARVACKSDMAEQRAWRLLEHSKDGPLPIGLNYAKAHTWRWSGGDLMNPQNFKRGSDLRKSLVAPKAHKINVVDSGQIEARVNALVSGQDSLLEQFKLYDAGDKRYDPYRVMAAKIYNKDVADVTNEERFIGKVAVLGLGYQMGVDKFIYTCEAGTLGPPVKIAYKMAQKAVYTYRSENKAIVEFWGFLQRDAIPVLAGLHPELDEVWWEFNGGLGELHFRKGELILPNGMKMYYHGIERSRGEYGWEYRYKVTPYKWSKLYGGLLCENIVQSLARFIVGDQVVEIGHRYRVLTLTHDECVYLSKTRSAAVAQRFGEKAFTISKGWYAGLPLKGEGGFDDCYSK